jgi:hypothetical protein
MKILVGLLFADFSAYSWEESYAKDNSQGRRKACSFFLIRLVGGGVQLKFTIIYNRKVSFTTQHD